MELYKIINYKNFIKSSDSVFQNKIETLMSQILSLKKECELNQNY